MARTKNFADVLRAKLAADPDLAEAIEQEAFNADIAMMVYQARIGAGLTQKELADRIGTQQSVISRIEDADYDGHSLGTLKRIAKALNQKLRVEFYLRPWQPAPSSVQIATTNTVSPISVSTEGYASTTHQASYSSRLMATDLEPIQITHLVTQAFLTATGSKPALQRYPDTLLEEEAVR